MRHLYLRVASRLHEDSITMFLLLFFPFFPLKFPVSVCLFTVWSSCSVPCTGSRLGFLEQKTGEGSCDSLAGTEDCRAWRFGEELQKAGSRTSRALSQPSAVSGTARAFFWDVLSHQEP